jgi:hypothetical protein
MNFNSNSDQLDIVSEVLRITKSTVGKYPLKDITRRVNSGLDRYFQLGFLITGDASLNDENNSVTPLYSQTLTTNTNAYFIPATGSYNGVLKLEALDSAGNSSVLTEENIIELNFGQDYSTSTVGVPSHFVKVGGTYYVRPTPNYTKASGLLAFTNNRPSYFASTDTTKSPGIPSQFHMFLARWGAQAYLEENGMQNAQSNWQHILNDEKEIKDYFLRMSKNSRPRMAGIYQNNR